MEIRILTSRDELERYDAWLQNHPQSSLWQSLEWGRYQAALGRRTRFYAALEGREIHASALVVIDRTAFGLSTWEIPRGPLVSGFRLRVASELMKKIIDDAKKDRAMTVFFSPQNPIPQLATSLSRAESRGNSQRFVVPEATRVLDLTLSEEELLAQMKPKGRYNIHLAERHGVRGALSTDVDAFVRLVQETSARDGYRSPPPRTYQRLLETLPAFLFLAYPKDIREPIAGFLGVIWSTMGMYYYGASSNTSRELMAPYLLQWEAMKYCKARGCTQYDLFGIAPEGAVNHPWAGVSEFKAKFGGKIVHDLPEQEIILRPLTKSLLSWKRKILRYV